MTPSAAGLDVVLATRLKVGDDGVYTNVFSVAGSLNMQIASRVVVTHEGDDSGQGRWYCSKDKLVNCPHSKKAQKHLQELVQGDPDAVAGDYEPVVVEGRESPSRL